MPDAAQVARFSESWLPYAQNVGAATGVSPSIILAQWGMESAYGTNAGSRFNNVAGMTRNGVPGDWQQFGTQGEFADAFSALLRRNYPQAVGSGDDLGAYASGLSHGITGSYFGGQSADSYAAAVAGAQSAQGAGGGGIGSRLMDGLRWLTQTVPAGQTTPLVTAPSDAAKADAVSAGFLPFVANVGMITIGGLVVVAVLALGAAGAGRAVKGAV